MYRFLMDVNLESGIRRADFYRISSVGNVWSAGIMDFCPSIDSKDLTYNWQVKVIKDR